MEPHLDFFNLMAYDFAGTWDATAGHQSNIYPSVSNPTSTPFSISAAIDYYLGQSIPASKIVLGMPLYGRAFEGTQGLGKPFSGGGGGSWENGVWDFKALPLTGAKELVDEEAAASYSFDEGKRVLVSYDNAALTRRKLEYIKSEGLGGAMWWESSADRTGSRSLVALAFDGLKSLGKMDQAENTLSYPQSKYDNLRNGMAG
ncbi:hypothetical protein MMC19_006471 [Ptychographa xylographoides]|nr:hypothetical protein [Ptychographa xylographoides]